MPDSGPGSFGRFRARFRDWRRSRPFWGGLLALVGGLEIVYLPLSPVSQLIAAGVVGAQSILVGFLIVVLGLFIWFSPANRMLAGVLTIIFSVSSLILSNLGGLVIGMMAGIIGGALTLSWTDQPRRSRSRRGPQPPSSGPPPDPEPSEPVTDAGLSIVDPVGPVGPVEPVDPAGPVGLEPAEPEPAAGRRPSPRPRAEPGALRLGTARSTRRRAVVVAVLAGLGLSWSVPATALPSGAPAPAQRSVQPGVPVRSGVPAVSTRQTQAWRTQAAQPAEAAEPSPECLAALTALPADLLEHLLPGLRQLVPGLADLLPGLFPSSRPSSAGRPGLLGLPLLGGIAPVSTAPVQPVTVEELRRRQVLAAQTCRLPQLLPGGDGGTSLLPPLPGLPLPELPVLPDLLPLPQVPLPELPLPGLLPQVPGLPLPGLPGLLPELPGLLPELPGLPGLLPELPRLPLPNLPLPQLPELPFPELPGLPGLPGVDPPPDGADPPLPVEPDPDAEQRVFPADDGDVAPTVTSDLTMGTLSVTSLVYQGIVELPTASGGTVRALRFAIGTIDADALRIEIPTHTGREFDLEHMLGNHVLGTGVILDCTSLSLTALGILPLTFTVDAPPPPLLALPSLYSTNVDIDLVTLRLRTLSVPTADASLSGPGTDPDPAPDV